MNAFSPVAQSLFASPARKHQAHQCPSVTCRQGILVSTFSIKLMINSSCLPALVSPSVYCPRNVRLSHHPCQSFVFTESMSRGWGLFPLQSHVLVGFWVSKIGRRGPGWCPTHLAFAALICHYRSCPRHFFLSLLRSQVFSLPASAPPSQILACPSSTAHFHSLTGV